MSLEVKVPQLPESVADATLVNWHKQPGDHVNRDENLVDLETDKVVLEVPAPASGVLKEIRVEDGTTVTAGDVLAVIEEGEGAASAPAGEPEAKAQEAPAEQAPSPPPREEAPAPAEPAAGESGEAAEKLSPAVRRLVEENNLDPSAIRGSGKDGRIVKADVERYLEQRAEVSGEGEEDQGPAQAPATGGRRTDQRVPMTRMRARIAERLVEAQQTAAMLTTFNEVDLSQVIGLRQRYRETFEKHHEVKLGFMSFFVKASIEALRRFPAVNASVEGSDIIYHDYYDVGIAVSTERGLLVPILRDADQLSFAEVERGIADFGARARKGAVTIEELTGGTFSITNGGIFGSMLSTPILNPPQSAILGMHSIQQRPVAVNGEVTVRPMMYLALTYDHRIVDGREAVQFLVTIKEQLEDPSRLLLQV